MADIIRLRGSPHEQTQLLLPWRSNGTLEPEEAALVEAHLAECAECRADAEADARVGQMVAGLSLDLEHGWAAIGNELEKPAPAKSRVSFLRRPVPVGWMIGGQAAAAVLLVGVFVALPDAVPDPAYRALGSAPANMAGNMVIVFQPEASEAAIRAALLDSKARVVDGPNASGAYVLHVGDEGRAEALQQLRARPEVMLAEPIDAGPTP
jgi:hypothetical protein